MVKKGGSKREFWENARDKDTIKMIHEDLRSSLEWPHPGMEEGMWAAGASPCTLICTAAISQLGKSSHPHQNQEKPTPNPQERIYSQRIWEAHQHCGDRLEFGLRERTGGGWEEALAWWNLIFLFILFPYLKVIQGR